jgi:hypothetical protein
VKRGVFDNPACRKDVTALSALFRAQCVCVERVVGGVGGGNTGTEC